MNLEGLANVSSVVGEANFVQHRQIPVACIQTRAHDRDDFDSAWPRILAHVDDAGRSGAKLIVLPEGTIPGYVLGMQSVSPELIARATDDLARLARTYQATLICGIAKVIDGTTYNAGIAIGPDGAELGYAAKQFLWHFDRRWYAPGASLDPIDTPLGRIGLLVCADGRIPSIAATLVERGAQMLVMPTAWVTSGRDPALLENIQADLMANVRARENGVPFVVANKVGFERASVAYCGKSALIDATGHFIARGGERDEERVAGTISIAPSQATSDPDRPIPTARSATPEMTANRTARIAFTLATDAAERSELRARALEADATAFFCLAAIAPLATAEDTSYHRIDGVSVALVRSQTMRRPRALVAARLSGLDCIVWLVDDADPAWDVRFARTRAAELRAYVIVFDAANDRAYAVDPDGVVVAGTFAGLRLAAFAYDRARAAATTVAPMTDVLAGLRTAEAIRAHVPEIARA